MTVDFHCAVPLWLFKLVLQSDSQNSAIVAIMDGFHVCYENRNKTLAWQSN